MKKGQRFTQDKIRLKLLYKIKKEEKENRLIYLKYKEEKKLYALNKRIMFKINTETFNKLIKKINKQNISLSAFCRKIILKDLKIK